MPIKRVWIEAGCIACGASEANCPDVFELPADSAVAVVKAGVDLSKHEHEIREAAAQCPVETIRIEEE